VPTADPEQLPLLLTDPAVGARLHRLGLPREAAVTLTRNRAVLLSWNPRRGLRLHAGFGAAPDHVLAAIVRFVARRASRAERLAARRLFMAFPVERHTDTRPPRPVRRQPLPPAERAATDRLAAAHRAFNAARFGGALGVITIRLSLRMRTRLGEFRAPRDGSAPEIVISRRHLRRHGWDAALETLLHEMVHQWQAESGRPVAHDAAFRRKAREVGISPRAVADLDSSLFS